MSTRLSGVHLSHLLPIYHHLETGVSYSADPSKQLSEVDTRSSYTPANNISERLLPALDLFSATGDVVLPYLSDTLNPTYTSDCSFVLGPTIETECSQLRQLFLHIR